MCVLAFQVFERIAKSVKQFSEEMHVNTKLRVPISCNQIETRSKPHNRET